MAKGKNFDDFSYGVGLEFNATSFKQVKDVLKVNLDSLSKMVKDYGKVLKIDPNADLSKLFGEMQKIKSVVDGINSSDNSFAGFVDKGLLSRIAALESGLESVSTISDTIKANMSGLKDSISSAIEPLKASGQAKFPATFDNLFGNITDQSGKIKIITDQVKQLEGLMKQLHNMRFNIDDSVGLDLSKNLDLSEAQYDAFWDMATDFEKLTNKLKEANPEELNGLVQQYYNVVSKMTSSFSNMSADQFEVIPIEDYLKQLDVVIDSIKVKKQNLDKELQLLQTSQHQYQQKLSSAVRDSTGKSLGMQSEHALVKVLPKVNDIEWVNKINDVIKNIEPQLSAIKLSPTFLNQSKNVKKEIVGDLAKVEHSVKVNIQVKDNIDQFNEKIQRIDQSIKNAKQQLEKNGNFKIRFEYEESGRFQDAAYKIINKFKKIDAKFYISNGKKFIQDLSNLKQKSSKELSEIPVNITMGNQDKVFSEVDKIRSNIENRIGNIGVNLTIANIPQFVAQAALMKDAIEQSYGGGPIGVMTGLGESESNVGKISKNMSELSEKAKQTQSTIENLKKTLSSLTNAGFKSKDFLNVGMLDDNGKRIAGSTTKLKNMLKEYDELSSKLAGDKSMKDWLNTYPELNGDIKAIANAIKQDENRLKQLEAALNLHLQKQIGFLQQQYDEANKVLEAETKITSEKKKQVSVQGKDVSGAQNNKDLATSAEDAAKKVRSLNGTLTQQKRALKDLEANGLNSSSFIRLGEWDKDSGSFKKNSKHIQELVNRYNELRKARLDAGGKVATGEEASIRGKLAVLLREQKKHMAEIIAQTQTELESAKQMSAAYKQASNNKTKAAKSDANISSLSKQVDELAAKLNKAKEALNSLKSGGLGSIGSTGLGDINNRLGAVGSTQSLEELVQLYNQLIAKKKQLESAGKTDSTKYTQFMQIYQGVEQQLSVIYQDQLKYTQSKIKLYETEIARAKELLQVETQQTAEEEKQQSKQSESTKKSQSGDDISATTVKLDGGTLNSLAKDATLKSIDGKLSNILTQLNNGLVVTGANVSIDANGVNISDNASGDNVVMNSPDVHMDNVVQSDGQRLANAVAVHNERKGNVVKAVETHRSPGGVYETQTVKSWVKEDKDDPGQLEHTATIYKQNIAAFDKMYEKYIDALAKQKQLEQDIANAQGPTNKKQAELQTQRDIVKGLEQQLQYHNEIFTQQLQQQASAEAIKRANQEIAKSAGAESDKAINKQNNDIAKIVNNAQQQLNAMQHSMQNSRVPMADAAIAKFKEYERLLTTLKTKQQEIAANPNLLNDESYNKSFTSLQQRLKVVREEFTSLQTASAKFLNKIKSAQDIKPLGSTFNPTNLTQLHNAMQEFANQTGVGAAKLIEFNDVERTATFEIKNGKGQVQQLTVAYDAATNSLGRFTSKTKESLSETQKFFASLKHSFQNVARYITSFGSVYRIFAIIRQGVTYVKEIDSALTELKKVTDETDASYERFLQNMSKTAGVVGSTVAELTTMAAEWARLGYSMKEASKLAESTAVLLNVSEFDDATKASEALISTMQAFQYAADDSQHVVDILNEVGNNFAVSSDGIATALQDSASALMEGGNSLEQAVALVAAANKVVQDPNSVGSALRTISLRLRGTSVEILQSMGEETDGVVESTSKLQKKLKALTGVDILTDAGAYKDTYTILKEIGAVWKDMESLDQSAALELMAGKNRANTLSAILNNMQDLQGAYEAALKSEGSALKENEAYLDSIQGKMDLFTNAVQTFWMNFADSNVIKGVVDFGTTLMKFLDTAYGKIIAIIGAVATYKKIKNGIKFSDMFNGAVGITKEAYTSIRKMVTATQALTKADIARTLASKGVNKQLVAQIIAESGLKGVKTALTAEQIKATAATLSAKYAAGELTAAQYIAAASTMGLKAAFEALGNVLKSNKLVVIAAVIAAAALALDKFITTSKEASQSARESFDEIQVVIDSTKSTLQELESELTTIQDKIEDLSGKQLSFAEDQELERLKKQRAELEYALKIQEQLLELQQDASNKQAVVSMKAYTKAASEGAEKTQENAESWGSIIGGLIAVAGIAASVLIPGDFGSIGAAASAVGSKIATTGGIAATAAGAYAGNKAGGWAGSAIASNDGTYDSWYETYTKALDTARKEEQKALAKYQKDSSNIDKLDKWQAAQKKTSEIETEMYEHLSQMQQYYNGLEYGISDEIDKELDTWYNFLDKLSIDQGASGAEVTALDRIFGENASEEIQLIKSQILDAINTGKDFDFTAAINGSEELSGVLGYVGLNAEDVKNYFTQIGEAAADAAKNSKEVAPVKTYSAILDSIESFNELQKQTEEIVVDNTKVTQEYKDALVELIGSESEVNEYFDENNGLIVKDAQGLNNLLKVTRRNASSTAALAKTQARLQYYKLYKELRQLTNGRKVTNAATLQQVRALYQEMNALEKTIAKYSVLEEQLLGAANAYEKFAQAQEIDSQTDYIGSAEELALALGQAFNTAELGTETAQTAIAGLVPESVYKDLDTVEEKMDAIYAYFKKGKIAQYFTLEYDDDGSITSAEMKLGNLRKFIEDGLSNGVFNGTDWKHFDLSGDITSLEDFAEQMKVTKEVAFAFLKSLEDHDIEWLNGDYSSILEKLLPESLENDIYENITALADLEFQLANGEITAAEYTTTLASLVKEEEKLTEQAKEDATAWYNKTEQLEDCKNKLKEYYQQLETGVDSDGNIINTEEVNKNIDEVTANIDALAAELATLEEPTELTIQFALDDIQSDIDVLEKTLKSKKIDIESNIIWDSENEEWDVSDNSKFKNDKDLQQYVTLLNDQSNLEALMDDGIVTTDEHLSIIEGILQDIYDLQSGKVTNKSGSKNKQSADNQDVLSESNTEFGQKVKDVAGSIGDFFTDTIPTVANDVKLKLGEFFTETVPEKWDEFWAWVGESFSELAKDAAALGDMIEEFFTETLPEKWDMFWDDVGDFFSKEVPYAIGYAAGKVVEFFTVTIPTKWDEFWTEVKSSWQNTKEWAGQLWNKVVNFFTVTIPTKWNEFWAEVTLKFDALKEKAKLLGEKIGDFFTVTIPEKWNEFWTSVGKFFTQTIPDALNTLKTKVTEFFTVTIPEKWDTFWNDIVPSITKNISDGLDLIKTGITTFFTETLPGKINGLWDSISTWITTKATSWWSYVKEGFSDASNGDDYSPGTDGDSNADGSAHAYGTAHKSGNWGLKSSEHNSLVGELGPEMVVNPSTGRYYTVGDHGAEMVDLPKGAIIFNHKQTEGLLKNGHITSRGKAYAEGNAHAVTIYPSASSKKEWEGTGYSGPDDPTYDLSEALDDAKDAASEFAKTFDWIEVRLEEINEQMDLLDAKVENAASASDKNALIDEMLALNETKLKNLQAGAEAYESYANVLFNKIPSQYREMARDGAIAITEFAGEADEATVEAIENYREWEEKAADLNLQIEELKKNNAELAKQKFDNVADEYDSQIDLIDKQNDKIDAQIDLMEERGYVASEAYYNALIGGTVSKGAKLLEERARLQKELDESVTSGKITKGSTDYNELVAQIYDVDLALIECTADIEEYQNAINDIKWDNFDQLIDRIDYLSDETQDLIDLMENSGEVVDQNGEWTDEGITSLGLYAQQMEIAKYRAQQYEEAIDELNRGYRMGLYSESEYQEKLNELKSAQYDSIDAYYEARDAIVDLNKTRVDAIKDGIDKEIDAYEKLIDKKKEALEAEKD